MQPLRACIPLVRIRITLMGIRIRINVIRIRNPIANPYFSELSDNFLCKKYINS